MVLVAVGGALEAVCRQLPYQVNLNGVYRTGFTGCWFAEDGETVTLCEEDTGRFPPQTFPKHKGDACRVLFVGGSSVRLPGHRGWPERSTIGELPVEVVNVGVPGATSLATTLRAQAALRYEPDVIVVYEGHNDLAQWSFGSGEDIVLRDQRLARAVLTLERSAFFRTLSWVAELSKPQRKRELVEGLRVSAAVVRPEEAPIIAAEVLANFTALVEAAGDVPVIQVVPISNPGKAPIATVTDTDFQRGKRVDEQVLAADRLFEAGDAGSALAATEIALLADNTHAGAWWVKSRALQVLGRGPEAVVAYGNARRLDAMPLRSTPAVDDAIRAVAADELIDLPLLLGADGGLVPEAFFTDMVHLSGAGHGELARIVSARVQEWCGRR